MPDGQKTALITTITGALVGALARRFFELSWRDAVLWALPAAAYAGLFFFFVDLQSVDLRVRIAVLCALPLIFAWGASWRVLWQHWRERRTSSAQPAALNAAPAEEPSGAMNPSFSWEACDAARPDLTVPEHGELTWKQAVHGLAELVRSVHGFDPAYIVGINRGGAILGGMIAKQLTSRRRCEVVYLLHLFKPPHAGGYKFVVDPMWPENSPLNMNDTNVLLVDDARYMGNHMRQAIDWLAQKYPQARIETAVLLKYIGTNPAAPSWKIDHAPCTTLNPHEGQLPWDEHRRGLYSATSSQDADQSTTTTVPRTAARVQNDKPKPKT